FLPEEDLDDGRFAVAFFDVERRVALDRFAVDFLPRDPVAAPAPAPTRPAAAAPVATGSRAVSITSSLRSCIEAPLSARPASSSAVREPQLSPHSSSFTY